jgi:hypothetical protein
MSRETKFGYGFLILGISVPYLIEKAFGPAWALTTACILLVVGVAFAISGHLHREPSTRRRKLMGTIGMYMLIGALVGTAAGGLTGLVSAIVQRRQATEQLAKDEAGGKRAEPPAVAPTRDDHSPAPAEPAESPRTASDAYPSPQHEPTPRLTEQDHAIPTTEAHPSNRPEERKPPRTAQTPDTSKSAPFTQSMVNSPGSIQAGGNVTVVSKKPPRRLTPEQQAWMANTLKAHKVGTIEIVCDQKAGNEPCLFASQIADALKTVGWTVTLADGLIYRPFTGGSLPDMDIRVHSKNPGDAAWFPAGNLQQVLEQLGYEVLGFPSEDVHENTCKLTVYTQGEGVVP